MTKRGSDPLLSEAENTSELVDPPTEAEMNAAITSNMHNLMTVIKAVNKFKALTANRRPPVMSSILGDQNEPHFSQPPQHIKRKELPLPHIGHKSLSLDTFDRNPREGPLVAEGVHRDVTPMVTDLTAPTGGRFGTTLDIPTRGHAFSEPPKPEFEDDSDEGYDHSLNHEDAVDPKRLPPFRSRRGFAHTADEIGRRGHAHDPLEDHLYLFIGPSTFAGPSESYDRRGSFVPDEDDVPIVSESPGAADVDIYETAYRDEVERILAQAREEEREPNVYLTRRVDEKLLAISGRAGRFMAGVEEAGNRFDHYTQFSARKGKVSEVSKALRQAAREEYDKRRQEKRNAIAHAKAKAEKAKADESQVTLVSSPEAQSPPPNDLVHSSSTLSQLSQASTGSRRAVALDIAKDKGRQARTSFLGFVDLVKSKSQSQSQSHSHSNPNTEGN